MSRNICWELATKVQLIMDIESFNDQKENTNDHSACEGEQQHQDIWCDFNYLQFL